MKNKFIKTLKIAVLPFVFMLALSACKKDERAIQQVEVSAKVTADQKLDQKVLNYLSNTRGVKLEEIKFDKIKNSYLIRGHELLNGDTVLAQYGRANEYKFNFEK